MSTDKRIRGRKLQAIRRSHFAHEPLCVICQSRGIVRLAEELDHIIPLASGGLDESGNRQGLCIPCHQTKSQTEGSLDRRAAVFPDWLEPSSCWLTIVFGPPGSGKSSHVAAQARPFDGVIELDLIRAEMSGRPIYQTEEDSLGPALWERNARLGRLAKATPTSRVWFIVSGAGKPARAWWTSKLRPAATVLKAEPYIVCAQRIKADHRRPEQVKVQHLAAADHWWRMERAHLERKRAAFGADGEPISVGMVTPGG